MSKTVRVKIVDSGNISIMNESAAQRLVQVNPKGYIILEPPKIEVTKLEPLQTEKKSAEVAETNIIMDETINPGRSKS